MADSKNEPQPVLLISERDEYNWHHIGASFVYLSEDEDSLGQPRAFVSSMYGTHEDKWADLEIRSQGENDARDRTATGMYAWSCEYHSPYCVNLGRAQAMVRQLT